ncbi:hypothetical protein [Ferviditalea candida]|uniref:Uncharacterized protein n=1 Tax=Ferviditalea candida TaxID=3108399 RepID=A0ABU5ZMG7_9BACL|nr:hypothetical protein [Paenibacillaceae bacterium T2]
MKSGYILKSPFDFDNAMFFGVPVIVLQNDRILDYGGPIERHTELSVTINGAKFLKAVCEFKVR